MSGKKHKHPEHVNLERWLVSYADFITLLFAFFVVLFSASQVDRSKTKKMALALESAFNRYAIFRDQPGSPLSHGEQLGSGGNANQFNEYVVEPEADKQVFAPQFIESEKTTLTPPAADESLNANLGFMASQDHALAHARKDLMKLLEEFKLSSTVRVHWDDRGVVISIREAGIFESGADKLTIKSQEFLHEVGRILSRIPNQVRVEGHTDDRAPDSFSTNWDLSTGRATFIIKWLLGEFRMDPSRFSAVGYGEFRPIADNGSEEGRQMNRRVDIVLLSKEAAKKEAPMKENPSIPQARPLPSANPAIRLPSFREKKIDLDDELKKAIQNSYAPSVSANP